MPDDREAPDAYDVIIAYGRREGEEGRVKWVETADGKREHNPGQRLVDEPLANIDLVVGEACVTLIYRPHGGLIWTYCPVVGGHLFNC